MRTGSHFDFLIIGQGLAGSLLAWRLLRGGASVMVLDDANPAAASRVAAGLINPVSGRRLVLADDAEALLNEAHTLYGELESLLDTTLLHPLPMRRLFRDEAQREQWRRRTEDADYRPFLGPEHDHAPGIHTPFGYAEQRRCARLDTRALLDGLRGEFQRRGSLREGRFDYDRLKINDDALEYDDIKAKMAVFCEGWRAVNNPWFAQLPLQPAQGSILTLALEDGPAEVALNAGQWLIPLGGGHWRLGASYRWEGIDERPSEGERELLLERLGRLLSPPPKYRVVEEQAGVRPGTRDKAPLLRLHPEYPALALFNGFGSHGSLLIPHHSARFAERLLEAAV